MKQGNFLVRCLGVPLISAKLRDCDCQPFIDKITSRIKSWTAKYFSFPGRLQLVDSVINSMVNFWLSVFMLPKKVIKAIERICCSYLWNGVSDSTKGAKVQWRKVFLSIFRVRTKLIWLRNCGCCYMSLVHYGLLGSRKFC